MAVADLAQNVEVFVGWGDNPTRIADWLDDDAGDRVGIFVDYRIFEHLRTEAIALVPVVEAVAVVGWRIDFYKAGHLRLEGRLALAGATGSHGPESAAVIA